MTDRKELWSEATTALDFGEGTKLRVGKGSVRVKGVYYRDDSHHIVALRNTIDEFKRQMSLAHEVLTKASEEKYSYDAAKPLIERIVNFGKKLAHERSEKQKLIVMLSDRDAEIHRLRNANRTLKEAIVDVSSKTHTEMLKTVISHV